ncbi:MAG: hypothetical protein JNK54_02110 [Elusimicrobia bacterium]|jgi:hypothetical protein|nr:hypothetical protein [Elusimicrobiota bacterium]
MSPTPRFRPERQVATVALLGTLLTLLSGCVYLRLLEVKKQLQNFDTHFAIGGRSNLVIEFKKPVLRLKDTRFLVGAEPLFQTENNGEVLLHYEFNLVHRSSVPSPPPLNRLSLDLVSRDGRLAKIIVPEKFMLLFPRNVILETLKQAKDAEVFELKKMARGLIHLPPDIEAELPSHEKTLMLLGNPAVSVPENDLQVLSYRYAISSATRDVPILAHLSFDASGLLKKVHVRWDQSSIEALFIRE